MAIRFQGTAVCKALLLVATLSSVAAMSGCKSGGGQSASAQSATGETATTAVAAVIATNTAPAISGSSVAAVATGEKYTFVPVASDPDGDALGFSIENRPDWATFDTATGRLVGSPAVSNAGVFADVRISVSDGTATTTLAAFTLTVTAPAADASTGAATLSWVAPTENTDGTPLTNLAGYRIHYGTNADALTQEVSINTTGTTTYMVTDLAPATYYFAIKAVTADGVESSLSSVGSKTIT
jgi:hypothetical protein